MPAEKSTWWTSIARLLGRAPRREKTLAAAAEQGDMIALKALAAQGALAREDESANPGALAVAVFYRRLIPAHFLIENGAKLNTRVAEGYTALHLALRRNWIKSEDAVRMLARALLDKGADLNARDDKGNTPLITALKDASTDSSGPNLSSKPDVYPEIATEMVNRGADLNLANKDGMTALMAAIQGEHLAVALLLVGKGAQPDLQDVHGVTALMMAAGAGRAEIVAALLAKNANAALKDKEGNTAATWAARAGKAEIMKLLQTPRNAA